MDWLPGGRGMMRLWILSIICEGLILCFLSPGWRLREMLKSEGFTYLSPAVNHPVANSRIVLTQP